MLHLVLHYCLFSLPSGKLVMQDLGKQSSEKNVPKLLYGVLHQPVVGTVKLLALLLPSVCFCGMDFGFDGGVLQ